MSLRATITAAALTTLALSGTAFTANTPLMHATVLTSIMVKSPAANAFTTRAVIGPPFKALNTRAVIGPGEASSEYLIGITAKLNSGDHRQQINQLSQQLSGLKQQKLMDRVRCLTCGK
jgi:hypothetical protein